MPLSALPYIESSPPNRACYRRKALPEPPEGSPALSNDWSHEEPRPRGSHSAHGSTLRPSAPARRQPPSRVSTRAAPRARARDGAGPAIEGKADERKE